jgi:hypothetical protein
MKLGDLVYHIEDVNSGIGIIPGIVFGFIFYRGSDTPYAKVLFSDKPANPETREVASLRTIDSLESLPCTK